MKKALSLFLVVLMLVGMLPMTVLNANAATAGDTVTYTFSGYSAGTQYAQGETHTLDSDMTLIINGAHLNTQVRLYAGSNAVLAANGLTITNIVINAGNKTGTLNVYSSADDGSTWTLVQAVSVASTSYKDYTVVLPAGTNQVKMESPTGGAQIRVAKATVTFGAGATSSCEHANTTTDTVDATCTEAGSTTVTCNDCGKTVSIEEIKALGHDYVDGKCSRCGDEKQDIEKATTIAAGDKVVIVCESKKMELSSFNGTSYANGTAYTDIPACTYVWTVETGASDGTYAFVNSEGAYMTWAAGSKNTLSTSSTKNSNSSWTIAFDNGNAVIKNAADSTRQLQWNAGSPRFACYTSSQTAIQIYTIGGSACAHTETTTTTEKATCTENGLETVTCNSCKVVVSSTVLEATGHIYENGTCTGCGRVAVMTEYALVTSADSLKAEDKLIIVGADADGKYYAMIPYASGNNLKTEAITAPVDGKISLTDTSAAAVITLGGNSTGWTLFDGAMYLYAAGGTEDNHLKGKAELPNDNIGEWTIEIDDTGIATITNVGNTGDGARNTIFFNYTNNLFAAYKADYSQGAAKVSLYRLATGGDEGGEGEPTEPEVTEPSVPTCPNENHNFVGGVCTICGTTEPVGPIDPADPTLPENSATYIFSDYNQEAAIEAATTYKLDDTVSITLSKGWLTSELRVYKGANVVFTSGKPIAQIDFNGGNKDGNADIYVTTDGTTWKLLTEVAYVTTYTDYSVKLPSNVIGVKIEVLDNQIRIKNATLTFGEFVECSHANATEIPAKDATCTESGNKAGSYCADCDTYFGGYEVIPATGHSYAYVDGTVSCSACGDAVALSTIAEAKAFTDKNQVYFVKGIVTYITGNSVYIEDATGAILVYFDKNADISTIALGDELAVWDTLTVYNGAVIETTYTLASESVVVSSGNTVPMKELTIAELLAATESKYLSEKITLKGVTVTASDYSADYGNVTYTLSDSEGNSIVVYRAPAASAEECFQVGDKVDVEAVVAAYVNSSTEGNGYQLTTDHTLMTLAKEEPTGPEIDEKLIFYRSNSSGGDLQLGDDIRATFMVQPSGYDEIYLEVTKDGVTTIVEKGTNSTSSIFRYAYVVPAAHMTMDINLTIWGVKDGVTYRGEELVFSVRRCAEAKLSSWITNPAAAGQCKLLMNMLYYGEKAQLQFSVNTDNLATTGLPQEYLDLITTDVPSLKAYPTVDETGKIAKLNTMGFMLQEKVKLNVIFTLTTAITNPEEYTIEVKHIPSREGKEPVVYTYTSEDFTLKGSKAIQFYFDKIAPSQMRDDLEYTVYHNGEAISATYVRSMETVAQYYASNAPALADLINAIMNYADAAKAVFG